MKNIKIDGAIHLLNNQEFEDEEITSSEDEISDNESVKSFDENELVTLDKIFDQPDFSDEEYEEYDNSTKSFKLDDNDLSSSESENDLESESESELESNFEEDEDEDEDDDIFKNSDDDENNDDNNEVSLKQTIKNLKASQNKFLEKSKKKLENINTSKANDFNLLSSNTLSISDMLSAIDSKTALNDAILLKDQKDKLTSQKKNDDTKTLDIPLPLRIKQRFERNAAFEITKNVLDEWEKDHPEGLDLLKIKKQNEIKITPSTFAPVIKPANDLESKIKNVLKKSYLEDDKKASTFEQIATAKLSVNDLRKKQNQLRMMRELMFREEIKARRLKKIKSKKFRKIRKKDLLKNKSLVEDQESDEEEDENDAHLKRASSRMTLKHQNNKWAKEMSKFGMSKDRETRMEIEEAAKRNQELTKRIQNQNNRQSDSDSNLEDSESEDEKELESKRKNLSKSGFLNMKFMKDAEKKLKMKNKEDIQKLRDLENGLDIKEFDEDKVENVKVALNNGRRIYTPSASNAGKEAKLQNQKIREDEDIENSKLLSNRLLNKIQNQNKDTKSKIKDTKNKAKKDENKSNDNNNNNNNNNNNHNTESKNQKKVSFDKKSENKTLEALSKIDKSVESNPWLADLDSKNTKSNVLKSQKLTIVDKKSTKAAKQNYKLKKATVKSTSKSNKKRKENEVYIDGNETLYIDDVYGSGDDESKQKIENNKFMFKDKKLIAEAFASDDVIKEFKKERQQLLKEERRKNNPKSSKMAVPGWGSWAGGPETKKRKKNNKLNPKSVKA
ncbi:uncharacterized protein ASCRUDRAFT_10252 [Ascoidea rubescens DSM 1968]|uniref:Small-subunit processome n=1 Tax=Ascoidea rubescens DSM 1968 TaxID=1344418 RepID=A0A1D2VA17_9ASCO|nr:hypothetical protein ASCRUDRAFT_10252 [Ascoidea rubescens DSM 1968]ODV58439.1 hypothetical protein ASCRUDRAFT_10252 [Ascoidea rubescens DSM 1968]